MARWLGQTVAALTRMWKWPRQVGSVAPPEAVRTDRQVLIDLVLLRTVGHAPVAQRAGLVRVRAERAEGYVPLVWIRRMVVAEHSCPRADLQ